MNAPSSGSPVSRRQAERAASAARARWLPEGRRGPMPWIVGIMIFLTLLSASIGLAMAYALTQMRGDLAGGYTIQIAEADAEARAMQVQQTEKRVRSRPFVESVSVIAEKELLAQLEPWIGADTVPGEIPVPALIDIRIAEGTPAEKVDALRRDIIAIAPKARMDAHDEYLGPVERLMRTLMWLAAGLVTLMIIVTAAVVMMAARSAYATHRSTIDIMHLLGATDVQIARLFQRRIALDAIFGSLLGMAAATAALWLIGYNLSAMDSQLAGMAVFPWQMAAILLLIPLAGIGLSMLTARITVRRALERTL